MIDSFHCINDELVLERQDNNLIANMLPLDLAAARLAIAIERQHPAEGWLLIDLRARRMISRGYQGQHPYQPVLYSFGRFMPAILQACLT